MTREEIIRHSWRRSQQYGVDPTYMQHHLLSESQTTERKKQLSPLFDACSEILEDLYYHLRRSLFMVVVSDVDGYIVFSKGDPPFIHEAERVALQPGANWSEKVKGTNGIGTALYEQKPIHIVGKEHYLKNNHFLTCYAAPLYDAQGRMIGILDVSGDVKMHHPHTFGMVVAAAEACQTRLLLKDLQQELTLHLKESKLIENAQDAFITVDEEGLITRINERAAQIIGEAASHCIGQPLTRWFEKEHVLRILSGSEKDLFQVKMKNKSMLWTVEALQDQRRRMYRSVLTFPEANTPPAKPFKKPKDQSIWNCPKAKKSLQFARHIAPTNTSIYIHGETGTGKEVIAREIHEYSGREGPLITVNCGAIPKSLIEAELFGYEEGAFTGAHQQGQVGKFRAAEGGTLFLDEIGEMPLNSQTVLLRALEERRITPIGSHRSIPVDLRVIAATHRNLVEDIRDKRFRADLYYRLSEVELTLPPLRKREDLFDLAEHFLSAIAHEIGVTHFMLSDRAKTKMKTYSWPGNIRELKHILRQAAYQAYFQEQSTVIYPKHLRFLHQAQEQTKPAEDEEALIEEAIIKTEGNLSQAAKILNIGRSTLYRKLDQYPRLKEVRQKF